MSLKTVASAATIDLSGITCADISGTATISTISGMRDGEIKVLYPSGAFLFTTGGNISAAMTATVGSPVVIFQRNSVIYQTGVVAPVSNSQLAAMAALSVKANATNASATPTDVVAASDFQVFGRNGTALSFGTVNLASTNAVTGLLGLANGGTNATLAGTGGANQVLKQLSAGAAVTVGTLDAASIATGALALARGGTNADLSASGSATAVLAQDASHVVTARALVAADIPSLDGSKITSGTIAMAQGGAAAALTASNGGVVISGAASLSVLGNTATAGKALLSGASSAPSWSTPTYPTLSGGAGKILRSDGTNNVYSTATYPDGAAVGTILTAATLNTITPLSAGSVGQVLICSTTAAPVPTWTSLALSRTTDLTMSASTSTSLGMAFSYGVGDKWCAYYTLMIQTTGGTAGLNFKLGTLPTAVTGRIVVQGNAASVTTMNTQMTTSLTTATTVNLFTASFSGIIEVWVTVQGGSGAGNIDLTLVTGASQAGSVFKESSVTLTRLA